MHIQKIFATGKSFNSSSWKKCDNYYKKHVDRDSPHWISLNSILSKLPDSKNIEIISAYIV